MDKLRDRVAIVTGGARGIGGAIASAFATEGADVVIADRLGEQVAAPVLSAIEAAGRRGLFVSTDVSGIRRLATRVLDDPAITPLPGTVGASAPFFSPDGEWVGFFAAGKLKKLRLAGGEPVTLCDAPAGRGSRSAAATARGASARASSSAVTTQASNWVPLWASSSARASAAAIALR